MIKIQINPVPKPRQTRSDRFKQRPCVLRYRAFADELRLKCKLKGYELDSIMNVDFFLEMPKSWSEKKKQKMNGRPHRQRPDIDNLCKACMDALLKEDSAVYRIQASKYWAREGSIYFY